MIDDIKNNICRGFLVLEAIIALGLFSICIFSTIALTFGARRMFKEANERATLLDVAYAVAANPTDFASQLSSLDYGNNANIATFSTSTSLSTSSCNSNCNSNFQSSISFNIMEPDTFSAYGKDTCPPTLDFSRKASSSTSVTLPIASTDSITDMSVKDGFAYISTNSSKSSDPDLFIFDMSDIQNPKLISSLNTGPGLAALAVAGPYIFAANESSVNQLQIIDIHDRSLPLMVAQAKIPLDIASSTRPNATAIYYDKGLIYLGTEKGDSPELTIWSVADPTHPTLAGRYEIGNKVEKIMVDGSRAYIASSGVNQLMVFDISNPSNPALITTLAPSGWQTQSGQSLDLFQGNLALGRDTGGFNNTNNPEFILYDASGITKDSSFDESGGIYSIVARPPNFLVLTHRSGGQLRSDNGFGTTTAAYDIPGSPAALSCDWGNIYVASNNSPSITLINDFHE